MADIFEEVEEQLRSDRYITMVRKGWPFAAGAAGLALAVALGLWGWDQYQSSIQAKASETYNRAIEAMVKGDKDGALKNFEEVAKGGPRGYRALALMQEGAIRLDEKKSADAIALFDEAAKIAPDKLLADNAHLKAAFAAMDAGQALPQIEARLTPLIAADRPFRVMAREALAMARLAAGKTAEARADFNALSLTPDATETARARAQAALALIDSGTAATLPAVIKAAGAMPEPAIPAPPVMANPAADPAGAQ